MTFNKPKINGIQRSNSYYYLTLTLTLNKTIYYGEDLEIVSERKLLGLRYANLEPKYKIKFKLVKHCSC